MKAIKRLFVLSVLMVACTIMASGLLISIKHGVLYGDYNMINRNGKIAYSNTYYELGASGGGKWQEGMVSGNGENG